MIDEQIREQARITYVTLMKEFEAGKDVFVLIATDDEGFLGSSNARVINRIDGFMLLELSIAPTIEYLSSYVKYPSEGKNVQ